ncbi:MAG TPA: electron-transfer flavoprotein:ubiquinone oxidoreductase [Longimicrobium sp.]|nr:electron-transfer flavoprotein:ubiquinone oxidoreductase [Longimicrobium sp.]
MATTVLPVRHQPPLPRERLILEQAPDAEALEMDVVIVGAGPAGLACAIQLAKLCQQDAELAETQIAVLDKAGALGEHNLSGAIVNPRAFRELFPDLTDADFPFHGQVSREAVYLLTRGGKVRIPTPPPMHNAGNYNASISEICRWLGGRAEELGVNVLPGFPVDSLLVEGQAVRGVRTTPSGLGRDGQPTASISEICRWLGEKAEGMGVNVFPGFPVDSLLVEGQAVRGVRTTPSGQSRDGSGGEPPTDLTARVTVLAEGTRGPLGQAWRDWQGVRSENPQIFALGVKELWETKVPLDRIVHTLGWPLPRDAFGGSFMYPLEPNLVAIGLVVGLDYRQTTLDVHQLLQRMKLHPYFRKYLEGGEMVEWGAKTIPEGGYYALAQRNSGDGVVMVGDTAGFVDVPSLKGIHYAMQSGMFAARAIFEGLKKGDVSAATLQAYDQMVDGSYIRDDMHRSRNQRLAFKDGFFVGGLKAGLMTISGGRIFGKRIEMHADADVPRKVAPGTPFTPDGKLTFSKVDAVFKSGIQTRDDIPSHLIVGQDIPGEVAELYVHMCPAGVYELNDDRLVVNAPNCIDCKATDVIGPRWTPREGGSGPAYKRM